MNAQETVGPQGRRKVTSRDIARLAGVSQSTVSRVLNNSSRITNATRERVLAAMDELGYRPNAAARTLITGRSHLIGLVVSNITNPFYPQVIEAIVETAGDQDYNVVLGNAHENARRQFDFLRLLVEHQVDGAILTSMLLGGQENLVAFMREGTPIVLVNRTLPEPVVDSVRIDNERGGRLVTDHLIGLGHLRIAFVGGREDTSTNQQRLAGFLSAMAEAEIDLDERSVLHGDFTHLSGMILGDRVLKLQPRPTAIVAADDLVALGCIDAVLDRGLRVPEDVAVVGFDDVPIVSLRGIGLTTVRQPAAEMGARAVRLLLDRVEGRLAGPPVDEVLPAELVVRQTCGARPPVRASQERDRSRTG